MATLGFSFLPLDDARTSASLREAIIALVLSDGWPVKPRYFLSNAVPGRRLARRPGMVRTSEIPAVLDSVMASEDMLEFSMLTSLRGDASSASCSFHSQRWSLEPERPLCASGDRPLDPASTHDAWLADLLLFADRARATTGVVFVMNDELRAKGEAAAPPGGLRWEPGPPPQLRAEWDRMAAHWREIGKRYMRVPRWGTICAHAHVALLGGVSKIADVVAPAVVRELSGGVYFQLTQTPATAKSPEAMARLRAFKELAEPLLPPA